MAKLEQDPRISQGPTFFPSLVDWMRRATSILNGLVDLTTPGSSSPITQAAPPGAVLHFAMSAAPAGWLKCNGQAVSRTTYAALFTAIGTTFGVGDGSTTFNLPELRGEFVRGLDDGRGIDGSRALGSSQAQQTKVGMAADGSVVSGNLQLSSTGNTYRFDTTGALGTVNATNAQETRPRNVALLACIKT